jgi:DNA-binding NtrC family response regulator
MPRMSGMDVLEQVKRARPEVEVVVMTAFADVDTAVACVKAGAYDFLTKPFQTNDAVAISVAKAAERKLLLDRTHELERELEVKERFGDIIGNSPRMREVYRLVEGVAASTSTVLILGESGTGKELVARAIHQRSTRADRPLVVVNCGAIPGELVESELFGHVKGAFTGATMPRPGLFETADTGTIFLDEVGDLPLSA